MLKTAERGPTAHVWAPQVREAWPLTGNIGRSLVRRAGCENARPLSNCQPQLTQVRILPLKAELQESGLPYQGVAAGTDGLGVLH